MSIGNNLSDVLIIWKALQLNELSSFLIIVKGTAVLNGIHTYLQNGVIYVMYYMIRYMVFMIIWYSLINYGVILLV